MSSSVKVAQQSWQFISF